MEIDQGRKKLDAAGLGVPAFAGHCAFQVWKPVERVIADFTPSLSSYCKGGFEQKMSGQEALLILDVNPSAGKAEMRTAHRRIMILSHPGKGGTPYLAIRINEAKDLLEETTKHSLKLRDDSCIFNLNHPVTVFIHVLTINNFTVKWYNNKRLICLLLSFKENF